MKTAMASRPKRLILFVVMGFAGLRAQAGCAEPAGETVRVMSFNLWHGGDAGRQPFERTVAVIKESRADIVGLQETSGLAPRGQQRPDHADRLAKLLGWHYLDQGSRTGIVSRFKIVAVTPKKWGAKLELPSGRAVYLFNVHLAHSPYQPYQLLGIPYNNGAFLQTADEAVQAARKARGGQIKAMLAEVQAIRPERLPIFVTGDFNEPSHLDWTEPVAEAKRCPMPVAWPSTKAVVEAGFFDAYRNVYPDPLQKPGLTWTPTTSATDPQDRHDRIDFVFVGGPTATIRGVEIVGEKPQSADTVVSGYPSDHRAVVAEVVLSADERAGPPPPAR